MKRRSREINIFSMSALDLFASALGAFILLAVIALPFFPNLAEKDLQDLLTQAQKETAAAKAAADAAKAELAKTKTELAVALAEADAAKSQAQAAAQELSKVKIPDLDIVIGLDVTGSMRDELGQLKGQILDLAEVLDALAPSVGIGIVAFGDRNYKIQTLTVFDIQPTANINAIQRFVANMELGMGRGDADPRYNPDHPEALYAALARAATLSWRGRAKRRYIILITDAPAYPEEISAAYNAARAFHGKSGAEHYVSTVFVRDNHEAKTFLRELARHGQGQFVDSGRGESILASIIQAIII